MSNIMVQTHFLLHLVFFTSIFILQATAKSKEEWKQHCKQVNLACLKKFQISESVMMSYFNKTELPPMDKNFKCFLKCYYDGVYGEQDSIWDGLARFTQEVYDGSKQKTLTEIIDYCKKQKMTTGNEDACEVAGQRTICFTGQLQKYNLSNWDI